METGGIGGLAPHIKQNQKNTHKEKFAGIHVATRARTHAVVFLYFLNVLNVLG